MTIHNTVGTSLNDKNKIKNKTTKEFFSATNVKQGVTVNWLAAVFGKSTEWIRQRLVDCPPVSQYGKSFRYNIKTAAEYLVDPKFDIETHLSQMKTGDLPASLQRELWDTSGTSLNDKNKIKNKTTKEFFSATNVKQGVTVNWLAAVFGKSTEWIRQRLVDCPPVSQYGKSFRYNIKTAAEYLVDPKFDIETHLSQMKTGDLPASLQRELWDARLKKQKWEMQAGDLWHTQDVIAILSSIFAIIKSAIQLWPDTVERQTGLTDEQRALLIILGDTLQDEIYQKLLDTAKEKSTKASIDDIEEESKTVLIDENDNNDLEDVI